MQTDTQYEIGNLKARMQNVEEDIGEIRADFKESKGDIKEILEIMNQSKGAWKTLVVVGSVAGAVGAGFSKLLPYIWTLPK